MKLVLLGAPGSGKGTLAQSLTKELNIPSISTGDLFRENIKNGTELGKKAEVYMNEGKLVPVELVMKILKDRLSKHDTKNGFILDGFPRSIEQAELLDEMVDIDVCLFLDVDEQTIINRISSRRVCKVCGNTYNTRTYINKACECGGELYQRDDDKEETVLKRLNTFTTSTTPLVDYYKNKGILKCVDGNGSIEDTYKKVMEIL